MKSFTNVQNGRLYNHISRNFGIFIFLRQAGFSASNQPLSFADASWFPCLRKFHGNASGKKSVRRFSVPYQFIDQHFTILIMNIVISCTVN